MEIELNSCVSTYMSNLV